MGEVLWDAVGGGYIGVTDALGMNVREVVRIMRGILQ